MFVNIPTNRHIDNRDIKKTRVLSMDICHNALSTQHWKMQRSIDSLYRFNISNNQV